RLAKGLLLGLTLVATPMVAFAQVSAIRSGVDAAAGAASLRTPSCSGTACVITIISNVISVAISFAGILLFCYLIYAGFLWMTATDSKGPTQAKEMIKNAIIGLVIIAVSYAIAGFVLDSLSTITTGQQAAAPAGAEGAADTACVPSPAVTCASGDATCTPRAAVTCP
ncbi:hypothetical protein KBB27_04675, partial [Patescibacteria group bacterium]|nr:hypothetical protein [Patescibacteria group bacterium]